MYDAIYLIRLHLHRNAHKHCQLTHSGLSNTYLYGLFQQYTRRSLHISPMYGNMEFCSQEESINYFEFTKFMSDAFLHFKLQTLYPCNIFFGGALPPQSLLNILMRSSPARSRKKKGCMCTGGSEGLELFECRRMHVHHHSS